MTPKRSRLPVLSECKRDGHLDRHRVQRGSAAFSGVGGMRHAGAGCPTLHAVNSGDYDVHRIDGAKVCIATVLRMQPYSLCALSLQWPNAT